MDESARTYMTRKERRQAARAGQRAGSVRSVWGRRLLLWGGVVVVLAGVGWLVIQAANKVPLPTTNGELAIPVSAADHISGSASASITLLEYGDYQCPACGVFYPLIKQVLNEPELVGKTRFVFRNFPLTQIHTHAQLAAQAAEAAALQGQFWGMYDTLYTGQKAWSGMSGTGARNQFIAYATGLQLDVEQFKKDLDSSAVKDRIRADVRGGESSGVASTPTFFVNGKPMPPPANYEAFKQFIITHGNAVQ